MPHSPPGWREILRKQIVALSRDHARQTRTANSEQSVTSISSDIRKAGDAQSQSQVAERLQTAIRDLPDPFESVVILRQMAIRLSKQIGQRMDAVRRVVRDCFGGKHSHISRKS